MPIVRNYNSLNIPGGDYISFYQQFLSEIRGYECPMYPSCSNYTLASMKQKGFVPGIICGIDRLVRCGHEHSFYELTLTDKGFKLMDPVTRFDSSASRYARKVDYYPYATYSADTSRQLIIQLINTGLYHEALLEINRLRIITTPDAELIAYELLSLNAINQYEKVIYRVEVEIDELLRKDSRIIRQYFTAFYKIGNYDKLITLSANLNSLSQDTNITYCRTLVFHAMIKKNKTDLASAYLTEEDFQVSFRQQSNSAINEISGIQKRSPLLAGLSSTLIPGTGYMVSGHTKTGITALLFNGLFGYATYTSFKSNNWGMGILTGLFGLAFYISNIQGSVKSAKRYNEMKYNNIVNRLEEQTIIYH